MPERDDVDRLLDSALSTYAAPEPGLEGRILGSIASSRGMGSADVRPRLMRRWLPWAIAVPLAAGLVSVYLLPIHRSPAPPAQHAHTMPQAQAPAAAHEALESSATRPAVRVVHPVRWKARPAQELVTSRALPKRDIFPSPEPLSPEERALAEVGAHAPEPVRKSLIEGATPDAPITISAIHIEPLKMPDSGQN